MAEPFYTAQLVGSLPFTSITVPGVSPSAVVGRRPARLDAETAKALKAALKAGRIPGVKPENVLLKEVDAPGRSRPADGGDDELADALAEAERQRDEAAERVSTLERALAEAGETLDALTDERDGSKRAAADAEATRDELAAENERLRRQLDEAAAAGDDAIAKQASLVLDSLTKPELKALADKRGVAVGSEDTKAEIVASLLTPSDA